MSQDALSNIELPPTRNAAAAAVAEKMTAILKALHPTVSKQMFATNLIVALNQLDASKITDVNSVLICAFNSTVLGLIPGDHLGLVYFIPRKGRCTLQIGYRGYLDLSYRNDFLKMVYADLVFEGEKFDWYVDEAGPHLLHYPDPERDTSQARKLTRLAYCIYETQAGGRSNRVLTRRQLDKVDTREHVWMSDYYEMARKSPLRRAAKDWRCSLSLNYALHLDEQAELDIAQKLLPGLRLGAVPTTKAFSLNDLPEYPAEETFTGAHEDVE